MKNQMNGLMAMWKSKMKRSAVILLSALFLSGTLLACGAPVEYVPEDPVIETAASSEGETEAVTETETESDETEEETDIETTAEEAEETTAEVTEAETVKEDTPAIAEDGSYDSRDEVALYIHTYGKLPENYLSKSKAQKLGWTGGSLENYAPGKCIGGSHFGNYEGVLPEGDYTECDIDTIGKSTRGAKRIVFSTEGDIYYTEDHYESFVLLYTSDGPVEDGPVFE